MKSKTRRVMSKKKKNDQELDTNTSFADMNVEGFSWYDPQKKQGKQKTKVSRKEYWQMVRAAFKAYLPLIGVLIVVGLAVYLLARVWLS